MPNEKDVEELAEVIHKASYNSFSPSHKARMEIWCQSMPYTKTRYKYMAKAVLNKGYRKTEPVEKSKCSCPIDMPCDCGHDHSLNAKFGTKPKRSLSVKRLETIMRKEHSDRYGDIDNHDEALIEMYAQAIYDASEGK